MWMVIGALAFAGPSADEALANGDFKAAARALGRALRDRPDDAGLWHRLGRAEAGRGRYDAALDAFTEADALGLAPALVRYDAACAAALGGRTDAAFAWLEAANAGGFAQPGTLDADGDLAALRDDPRWSKIRAAADRNARPCVFDDRYRAFDFWIGAWDVYAGGALVGTNRIEAVQQQCALMEHWEDRSGGTGISLNWVDPRDGSWHQNWVDPSGRVIVPLAGGLVGVEMHLAGDTVTHEGTTRAFRGIWTPRGDGSVRQRLEVSDDGEIWTIWFDGIYVPRGAEPPT